jgi:hypothetical protein
MRALAPALALALVAPAAAQAAAPAATTGGVTRVTPTSATLTGSVDPNGTSTTYAFQWGTTRSLGQETPRTGAGRGANPVPAVADLTGLQPQQTIFYRLVARNADGTARGAIRSFRTQPEPTGLTVAAAPDPVVFGSQTVFTGRLAGVSNTGQQVVLEQRPFPYTAEFTATGLTATTDATGAFAFAPTAPTLTTQYRAFAPRREVRSPITTVEVALRIGTAVTGTRVRRGARLKFYGSVRPARPGAQVGIQKRTRDGRWVTVAGATARGTEGGASTYRRTIRPPRGGTYRVFVAVPGGDVVSAAGREIAVRTFR